MKEETGMEGIQVANRYASTLRVGRDEFNRQTSITFHHWHRTIGIRELISDVIPS